MYIVRPGYVRTMRHIDTVQSLDHSEKGQATLYPKDGNRIL
jgi:hypothetical protein